MLIQALMNEEKSSVDESFSQYAHVWRYVLVAVAILGVGFGGKYFLDQRNESKEKEAQSLLFQAEMIERSGKFQDNGFQVFAADFQKSLGERVGKDGQEYRKKLEAVIEEYPSTGAAMSARIRLAQLSLAQKDMAGAEKRAQEVLGEGKGVSEVYQAFAFNIQAYVKEEAAAWSDALKVHQEAKKKLGEYLQPQFYMGEARALEKLNRIEDAKKVYKEIKSRFPNSDFEQMARARESMI